MSLLKYPSKWTWPLVSLVLLALYHLRNNSYDSWRSKTLQLPRLTYFICHPSPAFILLHAIWNYLSREDRERFIHRLNELYLVNSWGHGHFGKQILTLPQIRGSVRGWLSNYLFTHWKLSTWQVKKIWILDLAQSMTILLCWHMRWCRLSPVKSLRSCLLGKLQPSSATSRLVLTIITSPYLCWTLGFVKV